MIQRAYAHISSRGRSQLSLAYFIEGSKAKALWRLIVKQSYRIPDVNQRQELLEWARRDFKRHKGETDIERIKFLVANGTKEVHNMLKMLH